MYNISMNKQNVFKKQLVEELVSSVEHRMAELMMTQIELSRRMGVHRSRVTHLLRGHRNWTFDSLVKIAIALNMEVQINFKERVK